MPSTNALPPPPLTHSVFQRNKARLDFLVDHGCASCVDGKYVEQEGPHFLTLHRRVTDVADGHTIRFRTLSDLRTLFTHRVYSRKDQAPMFVPARYHTAECRHQTDRPHKCNSCVQMMQLCVFDMDQGSASDVLRTLAKLEEDNVAFIAYTTFSYPEKNAWRLILQPSNPIPAEYWAQYRLSLIGKYAIPCDPKTSTGVSHGYYLPSKKADQHHSYYEQLGPRFGPVTFDLACVKPVLVRRVTNRQEGESLKGIDEAGNRTTPPGARYGLGGSRFQDLKNIVRSASVKMNDSNATLVTKWLRGQALAEKGGRRQALWQCVALVKASVIRAKEAFSIEQYLAAFRPSLEAMIAEGSSVSEELLIDHLYRAGNSPREKK